MEEIELVNDGSGLGFGIVGGRTTGVVVRTIVPDSVADKVGHITILTLTKSLNDLIASSPPIRTGVSALVIISFASGRRPPAVSLATRLSRCCRDVEVR